MPDRPDSETSSGITDHRPGISGHIRAYPGISGHILDTRGLFVACRIVCRRSRRPVWPVAAVSSVAGSRAVRPVAWRWSRMPYRPSCEEGRRVRYRPSPDRVRYRPSPDHVSSYPGPRWRPRCPCRGYGSGAPYARRLPCPGPTWRCSRRRPQRFTNMYSFIWPSRFIVAPSAARLSAIVGPLAARHTVPNRPGSRRDRASPRIIGDNRTSSDIIEQSNITEHIANLNQL